MWLWCNSRRVMRRMRVLALVGAAACASLGRFTWVDELPSAQVAPSAAADRFRAGRLVAVQVFNHPEISGKTRVRDDGKVSIALLGDLPAGGKTPAELAHDIEAELTARNLAVAARATVLLEETAPLRVSVIGEVARPG